MAVQVQLRGDTAANWTNINPVLLEREMAFETDTRKFKIGDGITAWNGLEYGGLVGADGPQGIQGVQGLQGVQGDQGIPGIQGERGPGVKWEPGSYNTGDYVRHNEKNYDSQVDDNTATPGTDETKWKEDITAPGVNYSDKVEYENEVLAWSPTQAAFYQSKADGNKNNPVTDETKWDNKGYLHSIPDEDFRGRLEAIENTLAVIEAPYDTGWIQQASWVSQTITITHSLNARLRELDVKMYVSSVAEAGQSTELSLNQLLSNPSAQEYGLQVHEINPSNLDQFYILTGTYGAAYTNLANVQAALQPNWYYRVVVTKKTSVPLIQANYTPIKDWVKIFDETGRSGDLTYRVPPGTYKVIVGRAGTIDEYTAIVEIGSDYSIYASPWDLGYNVTYTTSSGGWAVGSSIYGVQRIYRWEDTTGANKPAVALSDGMELIAQFTNVENKTSFNLSNHKAGIYLVGINYQSTGDNILWFWVKWFKDGNRAIATNYVDPSGTMLVEINALNQLIVTSLNGYLDIRLRYLYKFTGMLTLSQNHSNAYVYGTPNRHVFKVDTTSGDVALTASDTWEPADGYGTVYPSWDNPKIKEGDELVFIDSGAAGTGNKITGLPNDWVLGNRGTCKWLADKDNSEWHLEGDNQKIVAEYRGSAGQTITNGPVIYSDKIKDTHSAYNTANGYFTAPVSDWYHFEASFSFNTTSSVGVYYTKVLRLIDGYTKSDFWNYVGGYKGHNFSCDMYLEKGQTAIFAIVGTSCVINGDISLHWMTIRRAGH